MAMDSPCISLTTDNTQDSAGTSSDSSSASSMASATPIGVPYEYYTVEPFGFEAYPQRRELRPVFGHKLNTAWKDVGPDVLQVLDSQGVLWTTIDLVRFLNVSEGEIGPVVLWIGVIPDTLLGEDAHNSAHNCLDLLKRFDITDAEVEYRESIYTQSGGPQLLEPAYYLDLTVGLQGPLTPTLGLSNAAEDTPGAEGTGGFYLAEGGDSKKVLLVTVHHVLLPSTEEPDVGYTYTNTSAHRRNVLLLGTTAYDSLVESIESREQANDNIVGIYERQIKTLEAKGADDYEATTRLEMTQSALKAANNAIPALQKLHNDIDMWKEPDQRILGHIVCSPRASFGVGTEGYTEDYAVVELDSSKLEKAFKGNMMDLRTKISHFEFIKKMYPRSDAVPSFKYSEDGLLPLTSILSKDLIHKPDMLDANGEPSLLVIKNGRGTDVTIGRATGIFSYVRKYSENSAPQTSTEWAILPYDTNSGAFSAPGDSGSVIADGLLTGGTGSPANMNKLDITYATPFFWLLPRIRANGLPDAHVYPVMT